MAIRIESLCLKNIKRFRGEHQLDLSQNDAANIDVVTGSNGLGKTTLADSMYFCLTGEFKDNDPLVTFDLVDQLTPGEKVSTKVSVTISDSEINRRFRFSRQFQTTETRRGPVNSVDPLAVQEEQDGEWVNIGSGQCVNAVFPLPAFTFCKLDGESSLGFKNSRGGTSWGEFVESLGNAAAQQAAARNADLPEYFSNDYDLGDELLRRVNELLQSIDGRYRIEERQGGLVGRAADIESDGKIYNPPTGQKILISQAAALIAADLMPASPPLIGDNMFGRVDRETRRQVFQVVEMEDRQVLLFALEPELDGLDVSPEFRVEWNPEDKSSQIISLE